jgi:hypothetical protein
MTNDVSDLLKEGIDRLAASVSPDTATAAPDTGSASPDTGTPTKLLRRARQHNRRRRQAIAGAIAAGTAAVTAAAVIAATVGPSQPSALRGQTITYVTTRAERALAHLNQFQAVETDTDTISHASFGLTVLNLAANGTNGVNPQPPGVLSDVHASRLVNWTYSGLELQQGYSAAGDLVFTAAIGQTGRQHGRPSWEAYGAAYPARIQWHTPLSAPSHGSVPPATCANPGFGYPSWQQSIAKSLSCHVFTLAGNQQVDGINTIKLVRKPVLGTHVTLWVDPTSYLPVRIMITDPQPSGPATVQTDDFRWLSPTTGNLATLHAAEQRGVIPPGFRSLPGTDVPVPGPATGPN